MRASLDGELVVSFQNVSEEHFPQLLPIDLLDAIPHDQIGQRMEVERYVILRCQVVEELFDEHLLVVGRVVAHAQNQVVQFFELCFGRPTRQVQPNRVYECLAFFINQGNAQNVQSFIDQRRLQVSVIFLFPHCVQ